jgi:hypothetical protein
MNIALLNTTICTGGPGTYNLRSIGLNEARSLVQYGGGDESSALEVTSFVGHESTAQIMQTLLGIPVSMNRAQFKHDAATVALCFKLNGRPEEGKILTAEEIETIGYEWFEMGFQPSASGEDPFDFPQHALARKLFPDAKD